MKLTMRLTLDGLIRALRTRAATLSDDKTEAARDQRREHGDGRGA